MKPEDIAVWERYISKNPARFESVDYDFRVGTGAEVDPNHPEEMQRDHTILTQKKIDAVAYVGSFVYLIEVKPIADMKALGQILTYHKLYTVDNPQELAVRKMIVCGSIERELEPIFAENNIFVEVA